MKNEIAGIQEACGIRNMHTDFGWGKLKEKRQIGKPDVVWRIILKCIIKKYS
jgi:hypothetical protein